VGQGRFCGAPGALPFPGDRGGPISNHLASRFLILRFSVQLGPKVFQEFPM
jgi:hypothetical protein